MRFKKLSKNISENLDTGTPYMLNKNGDLINCGLLHPYIKYHPNNDNKLEIEYLINNRTSAVKWLLENTSVQSNYDQLRLFLQLIYNTDYYDVKKSYLTNIFNIVEKTNDVASQYDIEQLYLLLNEEFNQEFCRARTSNLRFGGDSQDIYFRISSIGFNWFNLIWQCVYDNKRWIKTVTITSDSQAFNAPTKIYTHKGQQIDHMPTEEFLTLSGNPVIEKWNKWQNNVSISEQFFNVHPGHINHQINMLREQYTEEFFS